VEDVFEDVFALSFPLPQHDPAPPKLPLKSTRGAGSSVLPVLAQRGDGASSRAQLATVCHLRAVPWKHTTTAPAVQLAPRGSSTPPKSPIHTENTFRHHCWVLHFLLPPVAPALAILMRKSFVRVPLQCKCQALYRHN